MAAPIAQFDEEWENFSSFSGSADLVQITKDSGNVSLNSNGTLVDSQDSECTEKVDNLDNFSYSDLVSYESMEDLVHTFDEKLASCFRIKSKDSVNNLSLSESFSTEALSQDALWKRLTDNYGLVRPLNWETSRICKLYLPALSLPFDHRSIKNAKKISVHRSDVNANDSKENDQPIDYHTMIEYNVYTEEMASLYKEEHPDQVTDETIPQTADEVIEEIEEIMQDAANENAVLNYEIQEETGIIINENTLKEEFDFGLVRKDYRPSMGSVSSLEESCRASELKLMSLTELNTMNEDLEQQVKLLSSELLQELDLRDEFQFENEIKNSFISKVLEVQYKQEQFSKSFNTSSAAKTFSRLRRSTTSDSVATQGRYLTTVIPCNEGDVMTIEKLQSLIKILDAMKADSDEVPSLLTSYILKVLCPAPSNSHLLRL